MSSVKCFFSGVEGEQHYSAALASGSQHLLMSYFYLRKRKATDLIRQRAKKAPHIKWMIDSGAHTMQTDDEEFRTWSVQDWENYLTDYCAWLKANKDLVFCAIELDIESVVKSQTVIERWQDKFFRPLIDLGIDVMFVWHPQLKMEYLDTMCSKFPYVGIPGELSAEKNFNEFFTVARRWTTKLHGLAATKQRDFRDWPWYSVDSISWKTAEIYGLLVHFDEVKQKMFLLQRTATGDKENDWKVEYDKRSQFRHYFEAAGLNAEAICRQGVHPNPHASEEEKKAYNRECYTSYTKYALMSFHRMEEFYALRYKDRLQYYDLRLPSPVSLPKRIQLGKPTMDWWQRFGPAENFKQHLGIDEKQARVNLLALACVQYQRPHMLTTDQVNFLKAYFPMHFSTVPYDVTGAAKDLAIRCAPPNPAAIKRESIQDWDDLVDLAARRRTSIDIDMDDDEGDVPDYILDSIRLD